MASMQHLFATPFRDISGAINSKLPANAPPETIGDSVDHRQLRELQLGNIIAVIGDTDSTWETAFFAGAYQLVNDHPQKFIRVSNDGGTLDIANGSINPDTHMNGVFVLNYLAITDLNAATADETCPMKKALKIPATAPNHRGSGSTTLVAATTSGAAIFSSMRPHDQEEAALFAFLRANNNEHANVAAVQGAGKNLLVDPYTRAILFGRLNMYQRTLPSAGVSALQHLITPKVSRVVPTYNIAKEEFQHWHLVTMRPWAGVGIPGHHTSFREIQDDLRALKSFLQRLYGLPSAAMWTSLFDDFLALFDDTDVETSIRELPFPRLLLVTYEWIETLFNSFIRPDLRSLTQDAFITRVKTYLVVDVSAHRRSADAAFAAVMQSQPISQQGMSAQTIQMATSSGLNLAPATGLGSAGGVPVIKSSRSHQKARTKASSAAAAGGLLAPGAKVNAKTTAATLAAVATAATAGRVVTTTAGKVPCISNLSFRLALQPADCKLGGACPRKHLGVLPTPIGGQRSVLEAHAQLCRNAGFKTQLLAAIATLV